MRNVILPLAFLTTTSLVACSFSLKAGTDPQNPQTPPVAQAGQPATPPVQTTPQAAPVAPKTGPGRPLGRRTVGNKGPTPTPSASGSSSTPAPTPSTPATPTGAPVITGSTPFGSGTVDATGFKGSIFFVPAGTTKLPALASMQPSGFLFTKDINVAPQNFATGFPGVDAARKENFAIRYEAPLLVTVEADYDFRLVADDGAVVLIDNTPIVDNDGARATPAEKTGPVHLIAGTHLLTVDYLQTTGNVALQLFCKKANDAEKVCPTQL